MTYDTALELWWFPIKYIARLDPILYHPDCAIEEAHKMTGRLACFILQYLSVSLTHGDEELVYTHRRINSDFTTEKGLDIMFLLGSLRAASELVSLISTRRSDLYRVWSIFLN
jgi:hypothetical protein